MNEYSIRTADKADFEFLSKFSSSTFLETYVALNPENKDLLTAYVAVTFNETKILSEINNKNIIFYIIENKNQKVGYAKTVTGDGPKELKYRPSLEIEKIYILQAFKGTGLGLKLFNHIKIIATKEGHKSLWLAVYEQNKAAVNFYFNLGFLKIGEKDFLFNWNGQEYKDRDFLLEYSLR